MNERRQETHTDSRTDSRKQSVEQSRAEHSSGLTRGSHFPFPTFFFVWNEERNTTQRQTDTHATQPSNHGLRPYYFTNIYLFINLFITAPSLISHSSLLYYALLLSRVYKTGGNRSGQIGPARFRFGPVSNRLKFKIKFKKMKNS